MPAYKAYWSDQIIDVEAGSSYEAQQLAEPVFAKKNPRRKVKRYDIVVVLASSPVDPASL
jgi:hypothetical protein